MAIRTPTFTFADAAIATQGSKALSDPIMKYAINKAFFNMWNAANWRETIGMLNPFYLYPTAQQYGTPAVIVPSDFHGLQEVYCVNLLSDTVNRWPLEVQQNIETTHLRDWPQAICYDPSTQNFRVYPRVPDGVGSGQYCIDGTYKKRAPVITSDIIGSTTLPWDDEYFPVYCAALKWAIGGTMQEQQNNFAIYQQALNDMEDAESLNLGDENISPREALVHPFYRI